MNAFNLSYRRNGRLHFLRVGSLCFTFCLSRKAVRHGDDSRLSSDLRAVPFRRNAGRVVRGLV
jgi:hypothetical protein